ncbi:MAG: ATP-binding protein, partial [Tepidisphaeraceae bacterium]
MSYVTIIWSMVASACLTLAALHFMVWWQRRTAWADLLFTLTSVGVAAYARCELSMMLAQTPAQFAAALRWLQVPTWVIVVSLAAFVRLHLHAGRRWLAWSVFALRSLALLLSFLVGQNLNYREVAGLRHVPFLGEPVSLGVGVANPWMLVGQLSLLLLVIFSVDATITVWRRGDRRQALVTGGSIVFFTLTGMAQAVLVLWRLVDLPLTESVFFLGIVVAMGYEMSRETLRATQLSIDLRESEVQMTMAAEAAGFGIWIWTIATSRVWGSGRWLRMFGFEPSEPGAEVSYENVFQRIHPDDREAVESAVRHAVETGADYVGEYRVRLPDGDMHWIVARGRTYPDPQGRTARMLGTAVDVTARKQSEQEIARQRSELAHIARVFTMSQLTSSLAHELNQPLGAILRNAEAAELLLQDPSPDLGEVRAILADICKDDQRAGNVIDRLRSLLKRRSMESEPLDVGRLADEVRMLVRSDAASRHVRLEMNVPPDLPPVRGDRVHLQQVLLNLIINAMDAVSARPDDERRVAVQARLDGDGMVEVIVSDSGNGVPPEKLDRLFEPFFTTKPQGMGMGLPISRTIVEAHGGRIWVENNPEGGAIFRFTLCRAVAE